MTPDLLLCRVLVALPRLDREHLHRELSAVKRRRLWPGPDPQESTLQTRLLDALAVAPGRAPGALKDWLLTLPQDQALALVTDLLVCLAVWLRHMPEQARSLAVEDW